MTVLPSGKTQQTHIIQAIGILAGAPNVSVRSATAKTKTFELMGINPAEFVGTTIGNEKKARNPCDLAFNRNAEKLRRLVSSSRAVEASMHSRLWASLGSRRLRQQVRRWHRLP